jgi:hypothetical protein
VNEATKAVRRMLVNFLHRDQVATG